VKLFANPWRQRCGRHDPSDRCRGELNAVYIDRKDRSRGCAGGAARESRGGDGTADRRAAEVYGHVRQRTCRSQQSRQHDGPRLSHVAPKGKLFGTLEECLDDPDDRLAALIAKVETVRLRPRCGDAGFRLRQNAGSVIDAPHEGKEMCNSASGVTLNSTTDNARLKLGGVANPLTSAISINLP